MDGSYPAAVASSVLGGGPGGVLTGAAEAVAASLVDGTSLDAGRAPLRDLRDALLQEHADAGPDAEQRCAKLRTSFAQAVLMALAKRPQAAALLKGDALPHIPVEVRGTARRTMTQAVFSVGRAAECDIQMYGDVTLSRLQLIVISLPKAMVVVDAWSSGGTRVVRRSSPVAAALPSSVPQNRLAFVLAPDETAILLIGQKTTLTLGPMLPGTKAMAVPGAVPAAVAQAAATAQAPAAAPQTTLKTTAAAPEARAVPHSVAANVTHAGQAAPKVAVARVVAEPFAPSPARSAAPAPHGPTDASVPQADRQPDSTASRHTPASLGRHDSSPATAQDSSSSGGREVPGVPASSAGQSAPGACRKAFARSATVVRAAVRMQLSAATRKRLVARIRSAVRSQLLTVGQGTELEERMRGDANSVDEIRDILDGLGIPPAPQEPNYVLRPGSVVRLQGLEASTELNGTTGTVEEWLPDRGRWAVRLIGGVTKALKPDNLTLVADPEPASSRAGRCPRGSCSVPEEPRRQAECACGGPPFCSKCGGAPYHYHADCSRQEPLRVRWLEWLGGGREAYQRVCRQANREAAAHKRAIKEAMQITADAPGEEGDAADVAVSPPEPKRSKMAARAGAISGHGVCHLFTRCAFCGSGGQCIVGPRFRCLHCPSFDCCLKCEPRLLGGEHDKQHVFEILFESEFDWASTGITLPSGTRARLRGAWEGHAGGSVVHGRKRPRHHGMEGVIRGFKREKYELELEGVGVRHVPLQELQPLLSQKQAERLLAAVS